MSRVRYKGSNEGSGVEWFEVGVGFIRVWFTSGGGYEFTEERPGKHHVEVMKRLAFAGRGLSSYISRNVNANFARKL